MIIINVTTHVVSVLLDTPSGEKKMVTFPPSGVVAQVSTKATTVPEGEPTTLVRIAMGDPEGLPDERPGIVFITGALVLSAPRAAERGDLIAPYDQQRDANGRPTHCLKFSVSGGMVPDTMRQINAVLRSYLDGERTPEDDLAHYRALVGEKAEKED
jgi:hypothetical protein